MRACVRSYKRVTTRSTTIVLPSLFEERPIEISFDARKRLSLFVVIICLAISSVSASLHSYVFFLRSSSNNGMFLFRFASLQILNIEENGTSFVVFFSCFIIFFFFTKDLRKVQKVVSVRSVHEFIQVADSYNGIRAVVRGV